MKPKEACTRVQFKNVLFASDFSPASKAAAAFAGELARRYEAKLYALHVRPPVVNAMTPPGTWRSLEKAALDEDMQHTKELSETFPGIEMEVLIREGGLWSSLASVLEERDVDLVVIGTRGRSGIAKFVLGSEAEEIFRQAPCPVMTVGPDAATAGKRAGQIKKILFATDFSPASSAAAPYAVSLAQECEAHLTLLHVTAEPKFGGLIQPPELARSFHQLLHKLVPAEAELWCVPEYLVEKGNPAEKILEVAARTGAELIILGVRQPSGFPGAATHLPITTAHKVVAHARCPVLTIRG